MRSTLKYDIVYPYRMGHFLMKTKIIYISGAEVFDMADVRAAFDTVRAALNLGDDTVLFGVPVDRDSAFANADATTDVVTDVAPVIESAPATETESEPDADAIVTPVASESDAATEPESAPVAPRRRGRPRAKKADTTDVATDTEVAITENAENTDDDDKVTAPAADTAAKVVPILSVLAAKADVVDDTAPVADTTTDVNDVDIATISDVKLDTELVAPATDDGAETMRVTVGEMIADNDAPTVETEKTLEQLLESMTPLCDDHTVDMDVAADDDYAATPDSVDATLEKLATEFAETEPDITPAPKTPTTGGKIGKLKNILPFKKARRDDPGLMNSLFDWAGVAANDEEFAIPGFFANATSNK